MRKLIREKWHKSTSNLQFLQNRPKRKVAFNFDGIVDFDVPLGRGAGGLI